MKDVVGLLRGDDTDADDAAQQRILWSRIRQTSLQGQTKLLSDVVGRLRQLDAQYSGLVERVAALVRDNVGHICDNYAAARASESCPTLTATASLSPSADCAAISTDVSVDVLKRLGLGCSTRRRRGLCNYVTFLTLLYLNLWRNMYGLADAAAEFER